MAQQPEEKIEISAEERAAIFKDLRTKPFCSQFNFFLNVFWEKYGAEKETLGEVFLKFCEQNEKHGAKTNILAYPQFCKTLQQLEDSNARVGEALKVAGDRSSMSKAFQALGFKLKGDTSFIEGVLFLTNESVDALVGGPTSPADAALRAVKAKQASMIGAHEALLAEKAQLEKELKDFQDNHNPMKAMQTTQKLTQKDQEINAQKVQYERDVKKMVKEVKAAEEALEKEKAQGTEASKWLQGFCEKNHKQFSH